MPKIIWKPLHLCFPSSSPPPSSGTPAADDPNPPSILFINNFNLLFNDHSSAAAHRLIPSSTTSTTSTSYQSDNYDFTPDSPPPDLTAVFASRRFFFSSPGRSNSITESPDTRSGSYDSTTAKTKEDNYETATASKFLNEGTVVKQYVQSPDPYVDFRRSMEEMLDAANNDGDSISGGYEFLHELLLSYLSLNRVETHRFIIKAFADILVTLLSDGHRMC